MGMHKYFVYPSLYLSVFVCLCSLCVLSLSLYMCLLQSFAFSLLLRLGKVLIDKVHNKQALMPATFSVKLLHCSCFILAVSNKLMMFNFLIGCLWHPAVQ